MNWTRFQAQLQTQQQSWISPDMPVALSQMMGNSGKQRRAQLVFLTAQLLGEVTQAHVLLASSIESLHMASLLHDDVLDNGYARRGQICAHRVWGNKMSILSGDWWLAKSLGLLLAIEHSGVRSRIQGAMEQLVRGQIMDCQMHVGHTLKDYLQMIGDKTACLFGVAASAAAQLSNASKDQMRVLEQYGWAVGMAYQLNDDAAEYETGPEHWDTGHDFIQKKVTYPWMMVRDVLDAEQWRHVEGVQNVLHDWGLQNMDSQVGGVAADPMNATVWPILVDIHALFQPSVCATHKLAEDYTAPAWDALTKIWPESDLVSLMEWAKTF